jgi:hypothetical protein
MCVSGCTFVYVCMHACLCVCVCGVGGGGGEMCVVIFVCVYTQIYTAAKSICEYISKKKNNRIHLNILNCIYHLSLSRVCVYVSACALRPHYQKNQ